MCVSGDYYGACVFNTHDGIGCRECQEVHSEEVRERLEKERDAYAKAALAKHGEPVKHQSNTQRKKEKKEEKEKKEKKKK
jgi:hypothetical protein